eukprot:GHRQ01036317.1.p1 GENE.GHRQ01036317.1~~GHRQ01036317.1.p1  ORF type:complete len:178 (+),score=44.91 GHRQ01036317.1:320-853(+)
MQCDQSHIWVIVWRPCAPANPGADCCAMQGLRTATAATRARQNRQQQAAGQQESQHQQQQGAVLGYIIIQVNSITAHINKLAVAPHARRQGLGAALLRAALQVAVHERRALCSTLHVDASNAPALALYHMAGFQRDGIIADYYGPGKPALKLLADLRESPAVAAFLSGAGSSNTVAV